MKHLKIIIGLSVLLVILIALKLVINNKKALQETKTVERTILITHAKDDNEEAVTSSQEPTVPDYLKGEDSIMYLENLKIKSPISNLDLLNLAEVHIVENSLFYYNNPDLAQSDSEKKDRYLATKQDSAAMKFANRFMRMYQLIKENGDANDKLEWATTVYNLLTWITSLNNVNGIYTNTGTSINSEYTLNEITRVTDKFSSFTQSEMNYQSYISAAIEEYRTIESYREWLETVPDELNVLAKEEYEAWSDLNDARYDFWAHISYRQEWYSMKPMEINGYYEYLLSNRRAELEIERDIILNGKQYKQKGVTVKTREWESWIADKSKPEDYDLLKEFGDEKLIPTDSVVKKHVVALKESFNRWLKARQAIAAQLSTEQGKSYDNLTADYHSRMIGQLDPLVPYVEY